MSDTNNTFLCVLGELDGREIAPLGTIFISADGTVYRRHRIRCRHKGFQFLAPEGTTDEQIMDALIEGYRCTLSPRRPATPQARPSAQASCT